MSKLVVRRLAGYCGAVIDNVNLAAGVDAELREALHQALAEHGVIFFRNQSISPTQHEALARAFGEPVDIRYTPVVDGITGITEVSKEPDERVNIGGGWHADHTFIERPPWATILVARELPTYGGDTVFSSMTAAYEALSDGLQRVLEGLQAVHDNSVYNRVSRLALAPGEPVRSATHPVVIRNPRTGRKSLFVNPAYTQHFVGWNKAESRSLLKYLYAHGQRPDFHVRFTWEPGSIAIWDNWRTWHYAVNDYHGQRRKMHRIAVQSNTSPEAVLAEV